MLSSRQMLSRPKFCRSGINSTEIPSDLLSQRMEMFQGHSLDFNQGVHNRAGTSCLMCKAVQSKKGCSYVNSENGEDL